MINIFGLDKKKMITPTQFLNIITNVGNIPGVEGYTAESVLDAVFAGENSH